MSYKVLARKWRPQHFRDMIGQEPVLRALINALDTGRLHHAYLFTGMRGVGKTTIARIFARCLNCTTNGVSSSPCGECAACRDIEAGRFLDLIEVDAASRTKVDETRELLENVPYAPAGGRYKVYLIDEVHMFSTHSFNALLKTLEEPPEHVKFLLATTDPQKVPLTVLSRCLQFNLRRLPTSRLADYLATLLDAEQIGHERAALELVAEAAEGSVRDSLSLVEQAAAFGEGRVHEAEVAAMLGRVSLTRLLELLETLAAGDLPALFERVDALAEYAPDFGQLLGELLSLLHRVALARSVPGSVPEEAAGAARLLALAARLPPDEVQLWYQIGLHARRDLPFAPDPREAFDMALLRMHGFAPQTAVPAPPATADAAPPPSLPAAGGDAPAAGASPVAARLDGGDVAAPAAAGGVAAGAAGEATTASAADEARAAALAATRGGAAADTAPPLGRPVDAAAPPRRAARCRPGRRTAHGPDRAARHARHARHAGRAGRATDPRARLGARRAASRAARVAARRAERARRRRVRPDGRGLAERRRRDGTVGHAASARRALRVRRLGRRDARARARGRQRAHELAALRRAAAHRARRALRRRARARDPSRRGGGRRGRAARHTGAARCRTRGERARRGAPRARRGPAGPGTGGRRRRVARPDERQADRSRARAERRHPHRRDDMKGGIGNLMKQAQKMQEDMQRAQEEIATLEIEGQSGGGLVKVVMNGAHEARKVTIDDSLVGDDRDMLEDLVAAAINDASQKLAQASKDKLGAVTSGMQLPPGMKLPF